MPTYVFQCDLTHNLLYPLPERGEASPPLAPPLAVTPEGRSSSTYPVAQRRRKRTKKLVSRTYVDEEGCMGELGMACPSCSPIKLLLHKISLVLSCVELDSIVDQEMLTMKMSLSIIIQQY